MFLVGCPSKIYQLEALYFNDQYIDAIIQANQLSKNPKEKPYLETFLNQNNIILKRELLIKLNKIQNFPKKEDVEKLDDLLKSLISLNKLFPNKVPTTFIDEVAEKNQEIKEYFVIFTKSNLLYLLPRKKYRQAFESLTEIKKQTELTASDKKIYLELKEYLPRTLKVNKIKVHDKEIKKLISKRKKKSPSKYYSRGSNLLESTVNVPKEFNRHLRHFLKKEKSDYLSIAEKQPTPSYLLNCSVNVIYNKELLETRKEITNVFYVKYEVDQDWQQVPLTYEIFVQSKTYKAIIDADTFISKGSQLIGRFIFETIRTYDTIRTGDFMNDMSNYADIMYSEEYKEYQKPNHENPKEYFVKRVLEDAAEVLSTKVLSTIDTDPDPYSAVYSFEI